MVGWERGKVIIIIFILRTVENIGLKLFAVLKFSVLILSLLFPQTKPCSWLLFICSPHALTNPPPAVRDKRCAAVPFPPHRTVISRERRAAWWEKILEPIQTCCPFFFFVFPYRISVLPSAFINLDKSCWFFFFSLFLMEWLPGLQGRCLRWNESALLWALHELKRRVLHFSRIGKGVPRLIQGPKALSSGSKLLCILFCFIGLWLLPGTIQHCARGGFAAATASPGQRSASLPCAVVRSEGQGVFPFLFSFKSMCQRQCVAGSYLNILLPCCCGLEYSCSVADPGGYCLREQAYLYCKFFFCHHLCSLFLPFPCPSS